MDMDLIINAASDALLNVVLAVIALAGAYGVYFIRLGAAKLKEQTAQVFDEVKAAISPQAQQVITDNLGSFDKYLTAVIEDAVLKVKQADPYITLSGELAEGVELPAAGGTQ